MEKKGGMVAVVQGLQDSSLTVTLLDGGKQYTLMPNDYVPQPKPIERCHPSVHCASQYATEQCSGSNVARNRENGVQVTDGRYASTYKMMHCNLSPTCPPQTVTEFPPQRPEVVYGHGNFVIGGYGSGETARPSIKTNSFRGGMVWPDEGSVCASRASMQSDAFANSLRKYPNITPERSSEIVQRLISFTQAKNLSKFQNRCPSSPTRNSVDYESSKQTFVLERNYPKNSVMRKTISPPELNGANKRNRSSESSRLRDRSNSFLQDENDDSCTRPMFCKNNDVRCFRDTARMISQGFKNRPVCNESSSRIIDRYDCEFHQRRTYEKESKRSVNMEIQAAPQKQSKEILTLPRIVPMQRTIATPLSPIPSKIERRLEHELKFILSSSTEIMHECSCKSIQVRLPLDAHIKITSSSFDLRNNKFRNKSNMRSKSEGELGNIKKIKPDSILNMLQNYNNSSEVNEIFSKCPIRTKKGICQNCKNLFDDYDVLRKIVSNNTYFREDFNFKINQERTSNHLKELSKYYHVNGVERINKDNYKIQPEFLSHMDTYYRSNNRISDAYIKAKSRFRTGSNESRNIQYDCDTYKVMNIFGDRERCHRKGENVSSRSDKHNGQVFETEVHRNKKNITMTEEEEEEMKNLIDLDILAFAKKYRVKITTESLYDLVENLFDLFVINLNNNSIPKKKNITEKIKNVLQNRGFSEFQSIYLTNILREHWEEEFLTTNNLRLNSSNFQSDTLIVLPNIIQNSSEYKQGENNISDDREFSIKGISQKDIDSNVKVYISQISNEINDWLSNLRIPEAQNGVIRQTIINDLVTDIIDRQKYLELNSCSEISETSELEHLKYQIFKLIYKIGINDITLVDRATDLMERIQNIAVPIFSLQEGQSCAVKISSAKVQPGQSFQKLKLSGQTNLGTSSSRYLSPGSVCCKRPTCHRNLIEKGISESVSRKNISLREPGPTNQTTSTRRISSSGQLPPMNREYDKIEETLQSEAIEINTPYKPYQRSNYHNSCNRSPHFSASIKIIDDENNNIKNRNNTQMQPSSNFNEIEKTYNQYLKEWVNKLPIPMKNAEDQMLAQRARIDIYNGILEAVSKLRSERDTVNNRFLFEDKLDDEIEQLINKLPQCPELSAKKQIFKSKLIEQTRNNNDIMKSLSKSYKEQLVGNLKGSLPKATLRESENSDILEIYEELQILNIVEDFIICSHYQNQDPVVAEAYRKKLVKCTEDFIQELKANHSKALKNIDTKLYLSDILNTLQNVPLPSNETIQEEADEILLSIEIEKWFSDLPLIQNNDFVEQLHRKRLRNNLAKQVLDIEKGTRNTDNILKTSLKHEISQFLEKAPLQQGESLNINSMVDELIKRLYNRSISNGNDNKKVAFNEPDYEDFSRDVPLCSTYTEHPDKNIECQIKGLPSTKSIQAMDSSQQLHSGHYHNISKPLFDNLKIDQMCCNDISMEDIQNYESFDNTLPRSPLLKDHEESHWYTLQKSRDGHRQTNFSYDDIRNQKRTEQGNKSIQTIDTTEQSHSRNYHNIAQPVLDDLKVDSHYCNNDTLNDGTLASIHPRPLFNGDSEPNWYTLQESKQEYSQSPNAHFIPYPGNTSRLSDQKWSNRVQQRNMPEQDFNIPQQYLQNADPNYYAPQQRRDISYESLGNSKRLSDIKTSVPSGGQDENVRGSNNNTVQQKWSSSHFPASSSPRRHYNPRFSQRSPRLDPVVSPHRIPYPPRSPKENSRYISIHSPKVQNVIEDQLTGRPQLHQPDLFYRSTDPEGIRRTIDHNRIIETGMNKSNSPEHIPEYYQPSVLIPPCYMPLRLGTRKGHMNDRNIDERYQEVSDEENDEDDEVRCRCVEKMWKSKRRFRYYPFEQCEGFPMCVTSPYFYPYFY